VTASLYLLPVLRYGSIKWTFLSRKNGFYRCRHEWLWDTHACNVDKSHEWATMFANFQHGWHEPEVVISDNLRHFTGPCKTLFTVSAHDTSDGRHIYAIANSVRQLVTHQTDYDGSKPEVVLFNVAVIHCRPIAACVWLCIAYKHVLDLNDDNICNLS